MWILIIDTSKDPAIAALVRGDSIVTQREWKNDQHAGQELLRSIDEVLKRDKLAIEDIERIAVHTGPGGYSSLRAGVVTAQMISMARNVELVEITGHKMEDVTRQALDGEPLDVVKPRYQE